MKKISFSLRVGLSVAFIALTILASASVGISTYFLTKERFRGNLQERLKNISETAAAIIDGNLHNQIKGEAAEASGQYKETRSVLQKIRNANPDLRYVYTMKKEENKFYFVVDAEEDPKKMSHFGDEYTETTESLERAFQNNGQTIVETEFAKDQWGTWLSAYAPIKNAQGSLVGIVGVDIAAEKVVGYEHELRNLILTRCGITLLISLILAYLMATKISKSLTWLADEVAKVEKLDLSDTVKVSSVITEISAIGGAVDAMKSGLRSFKKYVPSDVVMDLLKLKKEANLSAEKRLLTIFFSDITGFTEISEMLPSENLSKNLGHYLGRVSMVIREYQGTVDKFIGDAVMAFWGAPLEQKEHALNACLAALECQAEIKKINQELETKGFPKFSTRIGINTGEVLVGNIGHEERLSYTVIGDAVNLASRIESLNKLFKSEILISHETWNLVRKHVEARIIDSVIVKGKTQPMVIYELIGKKGEVSVDDAYFIQNYNRAMGLYFEKKLTEALLVFKEILFQRPYDIPAKTMIARIEQRQADPETDHQDYHLVLREK